MKDFFKKYYKSILFAGVIILCVILMFVALLLIDHYNEVLDEQVETRVLLYTDENVELLDEKLRTFENKAKYAAKLFGQTKDVSDFLQLVQDIRADADYSDLMAIRYFKDGEEFGWDAAHYLFEEDQIIKKFASSDRTGCTGVVYSKEDNMKLVAFCENVEGSEFLDKMFLFYPLTSIRDFSETMDQQTLEKSEFVAFCSSDGYTINMLYNPGNFVASNANVFDELHRITNSKETIDALKKFVSNGNTGVISVNIGGEKYVLSVGGVKDNEEFCTIGLYKASIVYSSGYEFVNTILTTIVVIFVIMIFLALYFLSTNRSLKKKIDDFGTVDPHLGCPTVVRLERDVPELLGRYKGTKYALIVAGVKHYSYISETFGSQAADDVLKYINYVYSKMLQGGETYAYISDSDFAILLHYREPQMLVNRLRGIYALAYENTSTKKYNVKLEFGIYEIDRSGDQNVKKMIEKSIVARDTEIPGTTPTNFRFYKDNFLENYMQNADVEVKMDNALENGEFKVFFQPKYNIAHERVDGCEALVRWYDQEKDHYRAPATFLPLFETNGFIEKLDHYVYYKVCEFIGHRATQGKKIYPTSVNISRVTAQQPNFIEYYTSIKRKFRIPDNFIMLEFTESVAYENYEMLNTLVKLLHQNGFLCSIDDFGTGYSSYNILKVMNMDEIKLDKFFIERGISDKRDKLIIESVIGVAKELNMKVTQEGVETQDTVNYLRDAGCDVIQGYYFSKPLSTDDYEKFIDRTEGSEGNTVSLNILDDGR